MSLLDASPLTLDQLRVLDAIAETGSFTAAAGPLRRATSAVSYAVRGLEEAVGLPLFDRSQHRATLLPAGEALLVEARAVLQQAEHLLHVARELGEGWEPRLRVVLDGVLPQEPLMAAVRRFTHDAPTTRIELKVEFLLGVHERFEADEADLMLSLGVEGDRPELRVEPLPALEVLLVAAPDHPLTDQSTRKTREDLARHVELTVSDSSQAGSMRVADLGSPSVVRLSDFHAKREALLGGVGFGWLPRHLADDALAAGRLAPIPFEEGFRRRFAPRLAYRRATPPGRGARHFLELLHEELAKHTHRGRFA